MKTKVSAAPSQNPTKGALEPVSGNADRMLTADTDNSIAENAPVVNSQSMQKSDVAKANKREEKAERKKEKDGQGSNSDGGILDFTDESEDASIDEGIEQELMAIAAEDDIQESAPADEKHSLKKVDISIDDINALRSIGRKSVNDFTSKDIKKAEPFARRAWQELGIKSPFFRAWFGDWRVNDETPVSFVDVATIDISDVIMANGDYMIDDTGWTVHAGVTLRDETEHYARGEKVSVKALSDVEKILKNSVLLDTEVSIPDSKKKSKGTALMHKLYTPIRYNGKAYIAKITVEEYLEQGTGKIKRKGYQLRGIKIETADGRATGKDPASTPRSDTISIDSIADLFELVKTYDKEFNPKPASKIVDEDGMPMVLYHGTDSEFTSFDM